MRAAPSATAKIAIVTTAPLEKELEPEVVDVIPFEVVVVAVGLLAAPTVVNLAVTQSLVRVIALERTRQ